MERLILSKVVLLHGIVVSTGIVAGVAAIPARAEFGDELFKLTAPDPADFDGFGTSVAISGSKAIVGQVTSSVIGAPDNRNAAAYVYDATTGQRLQHFVDPAGTPEDNFGNQVAISGNLAIIGAAPLSLEGLGDNPGTAYVFDVTTGQLQSRLSASDKWAGNNFGQRVAIDGNIALVAAMWDYEFGVRSGSAYLFDVTTGQELFKLRASDASEGDWFGSSVDISGNIAIVGASHFDFIDDQPGAAYVFDVTTGQELFKLTAPNPIDDDGFGTDVAIDGNIAIVGADEIRLNDTGRAYLFDLTTRQVLHTLTPSGAVPGDRFTLVDISGDTAIVGGTTGTAYLFDVATGQELMTLTNPDPDHVRFGFPVAIDGNTTIVGATGRIEGSMAPFTSYPGAAYVFDVSRGPALAGDFNTDGTVDAADYLVWRNGLGTTYTQADYNTWRANFGRSAAGAAAVAESSSDRSFASLPEPTSVVLLAFGALAIPASRRRALL
jgi:outer membrane protein assembly factor BamB